MVRTMTVPSAEYAEIARKAERAGDLDVYFAALDLYDRARDAEARREAAGLTTETNGS